MAIDRLVPASSAEPFMLHRSGDGGVVFNLVIVTACRRRGRAPNKDPNLKIWIKEMRAQIAPAKGDSVGIAMFGELNVYEATDLLHLEDESPMILLDLDVFESAEEASEANQELKTLGWFEMDNVGPVAEHIIEFCLPE